MLYIYNENLYFFYISNDNNSTPIISEESKTCKIAFCNVSINYAPMLLYKCSTGEKDFIASLSKYKKMFQFVARETDV